MLKIFGSFSDLIYPKSCISCHKESTNFCEDCENLWNCEPITSNLDNGKISVTSVVEYNDQIRNVLLAYKEDGDRQAGKILASALLKARQRSFESFPHLLVPIPSSSKAIHRRGRDFMKELCFDVASKSGDQVRSLLKVNRLVKDQTQLDQRQRSQNLVGAFSTTIKNSQELLGAPIILVDDLLTTGATLREADRALCQRGHLPAGAITAAHTPRFRRN